MTAIEQLLQELNRQRKIALDREGVGDQMAAKLRFANLVIGAWPTIQHALEEFNRRRIA